MKGRASFFPKGSPRMTLRADGSERSGRGIAARNVVEVRGRKPEATRSAAALSRVSPASPKGNAATEVPAVRTSGGQAECRALLRISLRSKVARATVSEFGATASLVPVPSTLIYHPVSLIHLLFTHFDEPSAGLESRLRARLTGMRTVVLRALLSSNPSTCRGGGTGAHRRWRVRVSLRKPMPMRRVSGFIT